MRFVVRHHLGKVSHQANDIPGGGGGGGGGGGPRPPLTSALLVESVWRVNTVNLSWTGSHRSTGERLQCGNARPPGVWTVYPTIGTVHCPPPTLTFTDTVTGGTTFLLCRLGP